MGEPFLFLENSTQTQSGKKDVRVGFIDLMEVRRKLIMNALSSEERSKMIFIAGFLFALKKIL
jgi:hypothetical protein